jgi:hypothetical protein
MGILLLEDRCSPVSEHWRILRPNWPVLVPMLLRPVVGQPQLVPVLLERVQLRF